MVDIYEQDGRLFADGLGFEKAALREDGHNNFTGPRATAGGDHREGDLAFDTDGSVTTVTLDGKRLERHDFGAEGVARFQAALRLDKPKSPPANHGEAPPVSPDARPSDLVRITDIVPSLRLDIRYATANNFIGTAIYDRPAAYLQRPAAEALTRVQDALAADGLGLLIYDAYRPWSVTRLFWDLTPKAFRMFLADPSLGSQHNRGCAVDLTLVELASGQPLHMPGDYDEATRRSYCDYFGGTTRQRSCRDFLRRAMEAEAFTVHPFEWWHFDFKDAAQYAVEDLSFEALEQGLS